MNARERNALRWALVDVNNDLEGLKKQWGKIQPAQIQAVQDQVHKVIMRLIDETNSKETSKRDTQ